LAWLAPQVSCVPKDFFFLDYRYDDHDLDKLIPVDPALLDFLWNCPAFRPEDARALLVSYCLVPTPRCSTRDPAALLALETIASRELRSVWITAVVLSAITRWCPKK
jgi:hypothetical protein